VKRSVQTEITV